MTAPADNEILSWTRTSYDGRPLVEATAHFMAKCLEWMMAHPEADLPAVVDALRSRHR